MSLILGIHLGHDSSCAILKDGEIVAGAQTERFSRIKYHSCWGLSNSLPIREMLQTIGAGVDDLDLIISSFQGIIPGGVGFGLTPAENDFDIFNLEDERHRVISHHLAHAYAGFGASSMDNAAVLVSDFSGSSTPDGNDYELSFTEWRTKALEDSNQETLRTEYLSIYKASRDRGLKLLDREYCVPHAAHEVYVYSVASLYENITKLIFDHPRAHGSLMALAAYGNQYLGSVFDPGPMYEACEKFGCKVRNGWQQNFRRPLSLAKKKILAFRCQEAAEKVLVAQSRFALKVSKEEKLAVSGGVFLNILANSKIWSTLAEKHYFVPSAPNDAGIALGCAYYGSSKIKFCQSPARYVNDRIGMQYTRSRIENDTHRYHCLIQFEECEPSDIAYLVARGDIVARWEGRSEFGPRALGGRSLLASPIDHTIKKRLNNIKGRQEWRPLAPIVIKEEFHRYFDGPIESRWMNFSHRIKTNFVSDLVALSHPDMSARVQVLDREQDPFLWEMIVSLGRLNGYPLVVNTSLNLRGQPIVETPEEAIRLFLGSSDISSLMIGRERGIRKTSLEIDPSLKFELITNIALFEVFGKDQNVLFLSALGRTQQLTPSEMVVLRRLKKGGLEFKCFTQAMGDIDPEAPLCFIMHLLGNNLIRIV